MVLLLTNNYPPYIGGSSQILYELLRHFPENYFKVYHGVGSTQKNETNLPFKRSPLLIFGSLLWTQRVLRYLPLLYSIVLTGYIFLKEDRRKIKAVYAHYPSASFLIAAYFISILFKKPLVVYYDIVWEGRGIKKEDWLARKFESKILHHAHKVIAITEHLSTHLENKHHIKCEVIPHTTSETLMDQLKRIGENEDHNKVFKIHFAGAIYPRMNQDSLVRLARVLKKLPFRCELELCSPSVPNEITDIFPVTKRYLNHSELIESQKKSDLLFLPQAFKSDSQLMIQLNMPTKTMEYLCTGTPILVHSPKESYLTWLSLKEQFAFVVSESDEEKLFDTIIAIREKATERIAKVIHAKTLAEKRSSKLWAIEFMHILDELSTTTNNHN